MKNRLQMFFAIIAMFSAFCWLQSCGGLKFSGDSGESKEPNYTCSDTCIDDDDDDDQEPVPLTEDQKQEEFKKMLEDPSSQNGKAVKVCMAYIGTKNKAKHYCDKAEYNVFFNEDTTSLPLNLNNDTCRDVTLISGKTLKIGNKCTSDNKKAIKDSFGEEFYNLHFVNQDHHVPGTVFDTVWKDGTVKIKTQCGLKDCHDGTVSISMIGEVEFSDGSKKYLSKELVTLETKKDKESKTEFSEQEYEFKTFTLVDTMPEFDDYCGFKTSEQGQ